MNYNFHSFIYFINLIHYTAVSSLCLFESEYHLGILERKSHNTSQFHSLTLSPFLFINCHHCVFCMCLLKFLLGFFHECIICKPSFRFLPEKTVHIIVIGTPCFTFCTLVSTNLFQLNNMIIMI